MSEKFLSGFISIVGQPNVGKSTLLNTLCGEKVAIVSSKPQTTRNKINAVVTSDDYQMVFIDTPGIHNPKTRLGEYMVKTASNGAKDADITLLMVLPRTPSKKDSLSLNIIKTLKCPVFLVINKIDTVMKHKLLSVIDEYSKLYSFAEIIPICAINSENIDILFDSILNYLPKGPRYYSSDYITDQPEKLIVAELIREKALRLLNEEVPHGIAVVIDSMRKRNNKDLIDIEATIFCEKETHKRIIIGKNGLSLRKIGESSRREIESRFGLSVNLQLWVKVKKDWRENEYLIKNFGYVSK